MAVLLRELEQACLGTALDGAPGSLLHRVSTGIGLQAAAVSAQASGPADLHNGVADLARGPSAKPASSVDHDRAADPGPPPEAEKGSVASTCAQLGLGLDRNADVVTEVDGHADVTWGVPFETRPARL